MTETLSAAPLLWDETEGPHMRIRATTAFSVRASSASATYEDVRAAVHGAPARIDEHPVPTSRWCLGTISSWLR